MAVPIRFGVGVDNLNKLAQDLRRAADKELLAGVRAGFQRGGNLVRDRATNNFSWSSRIPATVRTFMPFGAITHVRVMAGGAKAPHAAAFENHGEPGFFRHPVFAPSGSHGDRSVPWVDQKAQPGLMPALVSEADRVLDQVVAGIDEAFRKAGAK